MERFFRLDEVTINGSKFLNFLNDDNGVSDRCNYGCIICIPGVQEVFRKEDG